MRGHNELCSAHELSWVEVCVERDCVEEVCTVGDEGGLATCYDECYSVYLPSGDHTDACSICIEAGSVCNCPCP